MKKIIRILSVFILLFFNKYGYGQMSIWDIYKYDDPHNLQLKGSVKSIEEEKYSALDYFGELKKDSIIYVKKYNLNTNNHCLNAIIADQNDDQTLIEWIYLNNYRLIETRLTKNDEIINQLYKYDNRENIIEHCIYKEGVLKAKKMVVYDKNNRVVSTKEYNEQGELNLSETYKYDLQGRRIEFKTYLGTNNNYSYGNTYKYKNGLKIEASFFQNDNLAQKTYYRYYATGKLKEEFWIDNDGFKYISYYNSIGNIIKKKVISNNYGTEYSQHNVTTKYNLNNRIIYIEDQYGIRQFVYNKKGYLIKDEYYYKEKDWTEGGKNITLFEYDINDNWIRSIKSEFYGKNLIESQKKIIIDRKITYR